MLAVPPPSDSATKTILSSIVNGFLAEFSPEVRSLSGPIVLASVEAYNRCAAACVHLADCQSVAHTAQQHTQSGCWLPVAGL